MNLKEVSTKELVNELWERSQVEMSGVEFAEVGVEEEFEVAVWEMVNGEGRYRKGGIHDVNTGPAVVVVVTD